MNIIDQAKHFVVRQPNTLLAIAGFILGLLVATEYSSQIPRIINPAISSFALDDMETKLNNEQSSAKESLEAIDNEVSDLQNSLKDKQGGLTSLVNEVDVLKKQVGLTQMSGEGVEIVLADSNQDNPEANAIAHASDLRDLVDFLWTHGAQAISIEATGGIDERVVFGTSIDCVVNTVLINSTKSSPPFKIKALGNRDALLAAVTNQDNLKQIYERVQKEGLEFYVTENSLVNIGKYSGEINLDHVKIQ